MSLPEMRMVSTVWMGSHLSLAFSYPNLSSPEIWKAYSHCIFGKHWINKVEKMDAKKIQYNHPPGSWRMEMQTFPSLSMLGCHISVRILGFELISAGIIYSIIRPKGHYHNQKAGVPCFCLNLSTGGLRGYSRGKRRWHLKNPPSYKVSGGPMMSTCKKHASASRSLIFTCS